MFTVPATQPPRRRNCWVTVPIGVLVRSTEAVMAFGFRTFLPLQLAATLPCAKMRVAGVWLVLTFVFSIPAALLYGAHPTHRGPIARATATAVLFGAYETPGRRARALHSRAVVPTAKRTSRPPSARR